MESYLGEILSVGCAGAWALAVVLFRRAAGIPAFAINLCKNALALVLIAATLLALGIPVDMERSTEDWVRLLVSGALGLGFADSLFLHALKHLGAGVTAIVECAYAPSVVLFAMTLGGESMTNGFLLGAPLVVLGVFVASYPFGRPRPGAPARPRPRWVLLGAFSVVCMALGIVIARPALVRSSVIEAAGVRMVGALLFQFAWALTSRTRRPLLRYLGRGPHWRLLLPSALLGSYLAMMMWIGGMKLTTAAVSAVLNQTSTIFTLIFARFLAQEPFTGARVVGAALAVAGAAIIVARVVLF